MSLVEIEKLLRQKIGVAPNIIGSRKIARAIENRFTICGVSNINDYWQILRNSLQELEELIEQIVVLETWFFRDKQPFDFLTHYIRQEWLSKSYTSRLRLLSVPCSTGEEPYSLAMTLLDLGLVKSQFQIDAIDISKKALDKARKAIYSRNSFRSTTNEFQQRYFTSIGKDYQLVEQVKTAVNFHQGNLLAPDFLLDRAPYDIIFCRNVLIYFDSTARQTALKNLHRLLKRQGTLLVGAAETGELSNLGFEVIRVGSGFIGRKADSELNKLPYNNRQNHQPSKSIAPQITPPLLGIVDSKIDHRQTTRSQDIISSCKRLTESAKLSLDTIRNLADRGNLSEATSLCRTYLQENSTSAEAYVLLGQVYQAQGLEAQAEEYFQKAIYLDGKNFQALLHLILLKEQRGDMVKATILRQRLQRLENRE
ncbi:CheR family methyltransferase [Calothrix sp. NIES-2098]|uniref:CheR family methyltransferase n=1 Tax=Calothrix sp. NIES-2098 TaxID=1954171 RepID=UPI000B5E4C77|nr:MCP methyltransferase, CheR-type with Tpr repeats [Calothrix sp. NIES-2098]